MADLNIYRDKSNEELWKLWREMIFIPAGKKYEQGAQVKAEMSSESRMNFDSFEEKFLLMAEMNQRMFNRFVSQDKVFKDIDELYSMLVEYPSLKEIPMALRFTIEELHGKRLLLK